MGRLTGLNTGEVGTNAEGGAALATGPTDIIITQKPRTGKKQKKNIR